MFGYYDEGAVMRRCESRRLEPDLVDEDTDTPEMKRAYRMRSAARYWSLVRVEDRINISTRCPRCQVYKPIGAVCAFCPKVGE